MTTRPPYDRFPRMKKATKGKKSAAKKSPAKKSAAAKKASTPKRESAKKSSAPAKPDSSPTTMGWGWPAFRYPLQ